MGLAERLNARARAVDSTLVVGLDPHPHLVDGGASSAADWCIEIIEATHPYAVGFKPNIAFFEAYGPEGMVALERVIAAIPDGIPVILDAKRGDIASTGAAYARAFERMGVDAVTVSPWMGQDTIAPFDNLAGTFVLCRTSNPGGAELQDARHLRGGAPAWATVAKWAEASADRTGLVVGATQPEVLAAVREVAPTAWILAPGVGAQGGDLAATVNAGRRDDGLGVLITVSRGIATAPDRAAAARELRDAIRAVEPTPRETARTRLAAKLVDHGLVKFGEFTLKSGLKSPIYIDLREIISDPELLADVSQAFLTLLDDLEFDRIAALPYAALPLGTAVALIGGYPHIYPRKEVKKYGTSALVEGGYKAGDRVVMLDDLATTGGSKIEAQVKLESVGLVCKDVAVLIDRESGAVEQLAEAGLVMHAVFKLSELLETWHASGRIDDKQLADVRAFLAGA